MSPIVFFAANPVNPPPTMEALAFILNIGGAMLMGMVIGLEREFRGHPAGLRTNSLVCLGAAMFVALPQLLGGDSSPTRVAGQVVSGIGFLGAGVIVRAEHHFRIRGLTSAACTWLAACVGIACGIGQWRIVAVALAITFAILIVGGRIERWLHVVLGGEESPAPTSTAAASPPDTPPD